VLSSQASILKVLISIRTTPGLTAQWNDSSKWCVFDINHWYLSAAFSDYSSHKFSNPPFVVVITQAKVASRFSICQVGICLFFQSPGKSDKLECDAYNIDTFDSRRDLAASPGALSFLAANGFDFNEW